MNPPRLQVVAAVIERDERILITLRSSGTHLAGHWEFPGGKSLPHESHVEALRRELFEELDIVATVGDLVLRTAHDYPDRRVELFFYRCTSREWPSRCSGKTCVGSRVRSLPRCRSLMLIGN